MELCCILPFYNFARNPIYIANHQKTQEVLSRQGIPQITIECGLNNEFSLPDCSSLKIKTNSVLWQKEQLINYGAYLMSQYKYIMWLDSGMFLTDNWVEAALTKLQTHDIIQLFSDGQYMSQDGEIIATCPGYVYDTLDGSIGRGCAAGGAWVARRELFDEIGLYTHNIVGGGDVALVEAILDSQSCTLFTSHSNNNTNELHRTHYLIWAQAIRALNLSIDYVNATFTHLWHSTHKQRQIGRRHQILIDKNYNPYDDVKSNFAVLEWTGCNPKLEDAVKTFMTSRGLVAEDLVKTQTQTPEPVKERFAKPAKNNNMRISMGSK